MDFDSSTQTTVVEIGKAVTKDVYDTIIPAPTPTPTIIPYPSYSPDPNIVEPTTTPESDNDSNTEKGGNETNMLPEILTNITDYDFNQESGEETFVSNGIKYITSHSVTIAVDRNKNLSIAIRS